MTELNTQPDDKRSFEALLKAVSHMPLEDKFEGMIDLMEQQDKEALYGFEEKNRAVLEVNGQRVEMRNVVIERRAHIIGWRTDEILTLNRELSDDEWVQQYGHHRGVYTYSEFISKVKIDENKEMSLSQQYDISSTLFFYGRVYPIYEFLEHVRWGALATKYLHEGYKQIIFTHPGGAYPQLRMHPFAENDRLYQPAPIPQQNRIKSAVKRIGKIRLIH